jgi:hypothetical protein
MQADSRAYRISKEDVRLPDESCGDQKRLGVLNLPLDTLGNAGKFRASYSNDNGTNGEGLPIATSRSDISDCVSEPLIADRSRCARRRESRRMQ